MDADIIWIHEAESHQVAVRSGGRVRCVLKELVDGAWMDGSQSLAWNDDGIGLYKNAHARLTNQLGLKFPPVAGRIYANTREACRPGHAAAQPSIPPTPDRRRRAIVPDRS
jgi:hypothetical protein